MDLSLVPIEDLYEEVLNRFDHAIFMGKKVQGKDTKISRRWKGDHHLAMGLCNDMSDEVLSDLIKLEDKINPEDL